MSEYETKPRKFLLVVEMTLTEVIIARDHESRKSESLVVVADVVMIRVAPFYGQMRRLKKMFA